MSDHWNDFIKLKFDDPSSKLTPEAIDVFVNYAGIPEDEVVKHIKDVRDRAYNIFPYPCIGQFNFLDFGVSRAPRYAEVLDGVKSGKTLLDMGCCFGQDLRKLTHDGADSANLTAFEMEKEFSDLGFELFRDKSRLKSQWVFGDLFRKVEGLEDKSFDYVHASSFFHLFSWNEQVELMKKAFGLLKKKSGSMLFGRQAAVEEAGVFEHEQARSGEMYRHDGQSFRRMVDEATKGTDLEGKVDVEVGTFTRVVAGRDWIMMNYAVEVR